MILNNINNYIYILTSFLVLNKKQKKFNIKIKLCKMILFYLKIYLLIIREFVRKINNLQLIINMLKIRQNIIIFQIKKNNIIDVKMKNINK